MSGRKYKSRRQNTGSEISESWELNLIIIQDPEEWRLPLRDRMRRISRLSQTGVTIRPRSRTGQQTAEQVKLALRLGLTFYSILISSKKLLFRVKLRSIMDADPQKQRIDRSD